MGQWLRPCTSTAGGTGSIPGLGTKTLNAIHPKKKKKEKKSNVPIKKVFFKNNSHLSYN